MLQQFSELKLVKLLNDIFSQEIFLHFFLHEWYDSFKNIYCQILCVQISPEIMTILLSWI